MRKVVMSIALVGLILGAAISTQVGLFVVQTSAAQAGEMAGVVQATLADTGAMYDDGGGVVYVLTRASDMQFIDSPQAICRRQFARDNDACQGLVQGWIMRESRVLAILPYSEALWLMASNGR